MRVTTVVLGDFGRSPRMQYHAEALAAHAIDVDVVACGGSAVHAALRVHPRVTCHLLPQARERSLPRALLLPVAAWRVLGQTLWLVWMFLAVLRKPDVILVQNPPAVPTLLIVLLAARLRRARLVIDWHNLAWAVLALGVGPRHPAVALARWYERILGRRADAHLCVSDALAGELARWGMRPVAVVRDRPSERFAPLDAAERATVRRWLVASAGLEGREPAVIVSPSSWTRDEDFDLLLEAVRRCEELAANHAFPEVLVLLTGRGARRAGFEERAAALPDQRFHVRTAWLEADDYPRVLGAADLGLCLHRSASKLDLPMKIADMHGAGLPVCALDYGPALDEMLRHEDTGLRFADAETLARQWLRLLATFPAAPELERLRANVGRARVPTWRQGWEVEAREILLAHA